MHPLPDQSPSFADYFQPISLEETNSHSAMLNRVDRKFVIDTHRLNKLLTDQTDHYRVLEIANVRKLAYRSRYFDNNLRSYYDHHQGRRKRFKIRIREYVDTQTTFFETKLKSATGDTIKHRLPCEGIHADELDVRNQLRKHADDWVKRAYGYHLPPRLNSALIINYCRTTLVAIHGGERVTIDTDVAFGERLTGSMLPMGRQTAIVETKTSDGDGALNQLFRKQRIREVGSCSKYCIGLVMLGKVSRYNRFIPALRALKLIDSDVLSRRQLSLSGALS